MLQFNDKKGKALAESTLEVEPFGGSSATRYGGRAGSHFVNEI
ncbi:IrmA family protein [Aeromonas veronii]